MCSSDLGGNLLGTLEPGVEVALIVAEDDQDVRRGGGGGGEGEEQGEEQEDRGGLANRLTPHPGPLPVEGRG